MAENVAETWEELEDSVSVVRVYSEKRIYECSCRGGARLRN